MVFARRFRRTFGLLLALAVCATLAVGGTVGPAYASGPECSSAYSGAYALGAAYSDASVYVPTCGPRPLYDTATQRYTAVYPYPGAFYVSGYQCMEFAERYLYYKFGVTMPVSTNGDQVVDHYAARYPSKFIVIPNGSLGLAPIQGDVISLSNDPGFAASNGGHTSVVQSASVNLSGNGTVTVAEENSSPNGWNTYSVSAWVVKTGFTYAKWLRTSSATATPTSAARTVASDADHVQVFTTSGNVIRQNWYASSNGQVGGWVQSKPLSAGIAGAPALVARAGSSVIDLFVRGGDGAVYETWYNWGNGAWGGWIRMGGSVSGDPSAVAAPDGHVQVFATSGNTLRQNWFGPSTGAVGGWWGPANLGAGVVGVPALTARSGSTVVDAFVRGGDGAVYETWYNSANGAWGGWIKMGGSVSSDPSAVAAPDGHVQILATSGSTLRQNWFGPVDGAIGGWVSPALLGYGIAGAPSVRARVGSPVVDAFVRGNDGRVYETWYSWSNGAWGGWIGMGGSITSDPSASVAGNGYMQVFGANGTSLRQNWFGPSNGAIGRWIQF